MNWLGDILQKRVSNNDTVLDLGCGIMQASDELKAKSILGVDIWGSYLNHIKDRFQTVKISMEETDRFMDDSYDIVICLDVVEHLEYDLALKIIDECKRICRRKAFIYTPSEFKDNTSAVDNAWGLGENPHQKHKCLLDKHDFKSRGYKTQLVTDNGIFAEYKKWE